MSAWPNDPNGSMVPVLEASVEAAKARHPSGQNVVLTAADRCDGCGAAAMYLVSKVRDFAGNRDVLNLCGHHWTKHMPKMADEGWRVTATNPDLISAIYNTDRSKGEDHA